MTDKDLLSINEAYAASQKARKEPVNENPAIAAVLRPVVGGALKNVAQKKAKSDLGKKVAGAIAQKGGEAAVDKIAKKVTKKDEAAKPDYIDADGDGDKKEPMKKALKDKKNKVNEKATDQRPKDEVKADEISKDSACAVVHDDLQEPIEGKEKEDKKSKKTAKESINNSNKGNIMSEDKTTFDKLYESVMGEDDELELGIPGDDGLDVGDEFGDEGAEEVTVTLTPDQADALKAIVDQLAPEEDPEAEEDPLGDPEAEEESYEAVEEDTTQTKDGAKPGVDPSDGGGKSTEPAADSLGGKSSGTGETPVTDEETTGKDTGEGKKPGVAKNAGKPGKQAV